MALEEFYVRQGWMRRRDMESPLINPVEAYNTGVKVQAVSVLNVVPQLASALNDQTIRVRLDWELSQMKRKCQRAIGEWAAGPDNSHMCYDVDAVAIGMIIHIVVATYPQAIGLGSSNQFWGIYEGDIGLDPDETMKTYLRNGVMYPPVPATAEPRWMLLWYWYEAA